MEPVDTTSLTRAQIADMLPDSSVIGSRLAYDSRTPYHKQVGGVYHTDFYGRGWVRCVTPLRDRVWGKTVP